MVRENIPEEKYFYLADGSVLRSLKELRKFVARSRANAHIFDTHVSDEKNDFYAWVSDALDDKELADRIRDKKDPLSMLTAIDDYENGDDTGDFFSGSTKILGGNVPAVSDSTSKEIVEANKSDEKAPGKEKKDSSSSVEDTAIVQNDNQTIPLSGKDDLLEITSSREEKSEDGVQKSSKESSKRKTKKKSSAVKSSNASPRSRKSGSSSKKSKEKDYSDDYKEDFDYSLDLEDQRDALAKIRERIANMDKELGVSSSLSEESYVDKPSPPKKRKERKAESGPSKKRSASRNVKNENNYSSREIKKSKHEISPKESQEPDHASQHTVKAKKNADTKENELHGLMSNRNKDDVKGPSEEKSSKVKHVMQGLYGRRISEDNVDEGSDESDKKKDQNDSKDKGSKKRNPLFSRLIGRFSKVEKKVADELPNLHEMEHAKKGEEFFSPYSNIDHPWNYHNHGFPDFVKGLLIGMVIGMLFLVIF